jgi:hypothetical protein
MRTQPRLAQRAPSGARTAKGGFERALSDKARKHVIANLGVAMTFAHAVLLGQS